MPPTFNLTFLREAPLLSYSAIPRLKKLKLSPYQKKNKQKLKTKSFIEVANNLHGHFRGEVFQAVIHLFLRNPAKSRSQNDKTSDI